MVFMYKTIQPIERNTNTHQRISFRSGSDRERGTETASLRLHQAFCRGPVLATVRDSEVPFEPSRARRLQRLEEGRTPSCICETSLRAFKSVDREPTQADDRDGEPS